MRVGVLEDQLTIHPLNRAELQALHDQLPQATLEERWEAFQTHFLSPQPPFIRGARRSPLAITPQELSALGPLVAYARDTIEETLAIDIQTADLRFVEGLLVVE